MSTKAEPSDEQNQTGYHGRGPLRWVCPGRRLCPGGSRGQPGRQTSLLSSRPTLGGGITWV